MKFGYVFALSLLVTIACSKRLESQNPSAKSVQPSVVESKAPPVKTVSRATNDFFAYEQKQPVDFLYHGNVKTKVLHGPYCAHYNCPHCTKRFMSVKQGIRAGYKPHACIRRRGKSSK